MMVRVLAQRPLSGLVRVPGDKSISHRALLLASLAEGRSVIRGLGDGADVRSTMAAVGRLGVRVTTVEAWPRPTVSVESPGRGALSEPADVIDAGNSGTTARLFAGMVAGLPFTTLLTGDPSLRRRPMGRVTEPLVAMGARIAGRGGGQLLPLAIEGGRLTAVDWVLPVASAQVKTALALAALGALLVVFFPGATRRVMQTAQTSVGPSFGVGCLTLLLAPIVFLLLLITLIGPVILVLALAAAWIFGWIAIGYLAGERILEALKVREVAPVLAVVVGVLLLAILGEVPCLGWLISLIVGTIGVGAVILTRFGTRPYPYTPMGGVPVPVGPMPPGPMSPAVARPEPPAPVQPGGPELTPSTGSEGKLGPGEPQG